MSSNAAWLASRLMALPLTMERTVMSRKPAGGDSDLHVVRLEIDEVSPEFDELWQRKSTKDGRLMSVRTSETIRWHFSCPDSVTSPTVLACRRGGRLLGYAVVKNVLRRDIDLLRSIII